MPLREAFGHATDADLAKYLRENVLGVGGNAAPVNGASSDVMPGTESRRRRRAVGDRLKWFRDQGAGLIEDLVDLVFADPTVRDQRKRFAKMATAHNSTKRLTDEASNLYREPPRRTFKDDPTRERTYLDFADAVQLDEILQEAQPISFLTSAVLFWAVKSAATEKTCLRLVTLDSCDPIAHPRDPMTMAGVLLDRAPTTALVGADRDRLCHFEVWDEAFVLDLDATGMPIKERREHNLGRLPGFLAHARQPIEKLVEWERGGDITAAQECVALLNLMALRLAKSQGENQPILKGDLAKVATKQPMDGERPIALPPGVTVEMLQSKTDPDHYLKLIKHFVGGVAQTYGMSYEQFTFQETSDTTSGRAYSVRRQKLGEIRAQQARRWRRVERDLVDLLGFDTKGFLVDFADPTMPTDPLEELEVEDKRWRMGLSNPVAFLRRKNPDIQNDDQATAAIAANVTATSAIWSLLRKQNAPAGADAIDSGNSPQANGAQGQGANGTQPPGANGGAGGREPQSRMATGATRPGEEQSR
jgi:hypothetical protein